MKKELALLTLLVTALYPASLKEWPMKPEKAPDFASFRVLDAKLIVPDSSEEGDFSGISDIAYDRKRRRLYAVSDNGRLYLLKLKTTENEIKKLKVKRVVDLKDKKGNPLKGKKMRDAEGMDLSPKGLLISFERRPRVLLFDTKGREISKVKLPKPLRKRSAYRGRNKMLEAVVMHPKLGVLSAPELPLENAEKNRHTVYGKGIRLQMPLSGSLTAMAVTKKGNLLILERAFDRLTRRRVITLSILYPEKRICRRIARLDSDKGWRLDNFEGLASLGKNRFLMISDDNENPLQKRLLVLFEIAE
ncbi:esterase-like activity of phytase family protein [Hydrogenimonas sp.]